MKNQKTPQTVCSLQTFAGTAISPTDGRYSDRAKELSDVFSEFGLMRYRVKVEVEYLIALHFVIKDMNVTPFVRKISRSECNFLRNLYKKFSNDDFIVIKQFEVTTNHDVKAVEYFIRTKISNTSLSDLLAFVHYGLTSEDINNIAYALELRDGTEILVQNSLELSSEIDKLAEKSKDISMLALTHGQPASPTNLGWEVNIFSERLMRINTEMMNFCLLVKWNGATGGNNSLCIAHPEINWRTFASNFIKVFESEECPKRIKFMINKFTNQIEPHDTYAKLFDLIKEGNSVLLSFAQNMWGYISREIFVQELIAGEIGSTAMPHKINPINFENAEGNLGIANALLNFFSQKLPVSRFQRDLSDSSVIRYFGVAYASTLIAIKSIKKGLKRLSINRKYIYEELNNHWEVLAEAYQIILRREGIAEGYEMMLEYTKGKKMTKGLLHEFVDKLSSSNDLLTDKVIGELKSLTPHNYIGDREF